MERKNCYEKCKQGRKRAAEEERERAREWDRATVGRRGRREKRRLGMAGVRVTLKEREDTRVIQADWFLASPQHARHTDHRDV